MSGCEQALSSDPDDVNGVDPWARDAFGEKLAWLESTLVPDYLRLGTQMEDFLWRLRGRDQVS